MTDTTADEVEVGAEVVAGYRVVDLLRRGRRIDTYDVYSVQRDCRCVVKILRPDRGLDKRVRDAVVLEGTLLRDLSHPHLVRAYEVVEEPLPAMVLETLGGATLSALVERRRLGVVDAAELGLQLTSVLGYLHRQGWLHLDVKPSNVVVENGRATLIDLSLVGRPGRGRPGAGTRGYLAPEQAHGQNLSAATDVWGLGVTLLESLTGRLPYGDEATWDTGPREFSLPVAPRRDWRVRRLPTRLSDLLRSCVDVDAAARPTLVDVRRTLTTLTGGR